MKYFCILLIFSSYIFCALEEEMTGHKDPIEYFGGKKIDKETVKFEGVKDSKNGLSIVVKMKGYVGIILDIYDSYSILDASGSKASLKEVDINDISKLAISNVTLGTEDLSEKEISSRWTFKNQGSLDDLRKKVFVIGLIEADKYADYLEEQKEGFTDSYKFASTLKYSSRNLKKFGYSELVILFNPDKDNEYDVIITAQNKLEDWENSSKILKDTFLKVIYSIVSATVGFVAFVAVFYFSLSKFI